MTETKKRIGRPPDPGKVEAILEAGWTLFLARGFEAVSVEAIAEEAGVSRVTFYKHFPDKAALFEAAVLRATQRIEAQQKGPEDVAPGPLSERLERFGVELMRFLGSPMAVSFYGVLSGELRHHPRVARAFYELGPGRTIGNLAAILREAAERGEIQVASPELAAEMLVGLWQGMSNYRLALGVDPERYEAELVERVRYGIELFLRGCGRERVSKKSTRGTGARKGDGLDG
ncbi:TetR/AcrR family transcriptional regulator [Archangium sp.]|uniref:TetR/AcrR family transcriptional regulator n=1 Tax=Archangium sp. TaxID=1872627 RepID=UPI00286CFC82|nr:TetR/AcrR family transcriptional regulator [Archangium sp.]